MRVMTEEHKKALQAGRQKAKLEKLSGTKPVEEKVKKSKLPLDKQEYILEVDGKEKNAFDYFSAIRMSMRQKHNYTGYPKILKEIADPIYWQNNVKILEKLKKYFTIKQVKTKKNHFK